MNEDKISVIVPVYKVEKYLSKCVDSIVAQTYKNLEIILVDDGSPDNCGTICDDYSQTDSRIRVIHKENGGLSSARNRGLEISTGSYVLFIDSDDWIDDKYVEELHDSIITSNSDIAVPAFCLSYSNGNQIIDSRIREMDVFSTEQALEIFLFNGYLTPCVASKLWKRELWNSIRCPEGKLFEDQYTTYKLLMKSKRVVYVPYVNYYYFKRDGSIGHSDFTNRTYDLLFGIKEEYDVITEAYPHIKNSMKVARAVWEIVFINMMITSNKNDKKTTEEIRKRTKECLPHILKCHYLPTVRKCEMFLFCWNYRLYVNIYKRYKLIKKIS